MSKNKVNPQPGKIAAQPCAASPEPAKASGFRIPYPMVVLAIIAFVVYAGTLSYGLTELDDSIFIREFSAYNQDMGNLVASFGRGLFDVVKDPYYRPLFMDSIILNYHFGGGEDHYTVYHLFNLLFHVTSVVLLYRLFLKLNVKTVQAFILSMIFAVLPVLTQDVAWIPGRNDTILAIFVLAFFAQSINYSNTGKASNLILSFVFLALALFTKETAVLAAPVAFLLLALVLHKDWKARNQLIQYSAWAGALLLWFLVRRAATVQTQGVTPGQMASDFAHRLPMLVQYLGKIFFPFNLSVFPMQADTVYYFGIAAIALLAAVVLLYKNRDLGVVGAGFAIFLLFLLPAMLVPKSLNEQAFEHRLYTPVIGILLVLSQSVLLNNKLTDKQLLIGGGLVAALFAGISMMHQPNFSDPRTFWSQAVKTSPGSAYARMMMAARMDKPEEFNTACAMFREAYYIDSNQKYINFYMAEMLQKKDSVLASEYYLLREKKISDYVQCDFYLARVAMEKKDKTSAITYLESFLKRAPNNPMANNNLLLLLLDTQQRDKAKAQVKHMQEVELPVPADITRQLN